MLLTVDQAAERLGTTSRFIRRLRTERRIPIIPPGKHIRIDSNDLDAYTHAARHGPVRPARSLTHPGRPPGSAPVLHSLL